MDSAFEKAVIRFRASLTKSQREEFMHCTQQDVERTIKDIQARHGSQKRLKNMRRVSKFIEGMSQLGQVIEVFLNLDNTVAFVWGPIKLILLTASTWVDTLDLLLETYAEIGETLPSLSQYPKLFSSYPFVQKHLENYYGDVLEFNRSALEVFARPGWKAVFHSSWKTFRSQFNPILTSFKRHQQLLADEKVTALMSEVQTLSHNAEERFQFLENEINARHARDSEKELAEIEEARYRQRRIVQGRLNAPDFYNDHENACQIRQRNSSGDWILNNSKFQEWVELGTVSSKRFYLNGMPGAGKTILVSRIIDYLKERQAARKALGQNFSVIYFYFKHLHDNKRRMTHLLLGLLSQLADQDNSLLDFLYREFSSIDQQELSLHKLCDLASTALRAQRRCFIVIDGLDECESGPGDGKTKDVERMLKWFEELMLPEEEAVPDRNLCVRLLFSGQRDGYLEGRLESYPSIKLETIAEHGEDIKSYAKVEAADICKQFSAGMEVEQDIILKVTTRAKGMFLFAKIVLNNLSDQISVYDFQSELKTENFPTGLDEAYERVVGQVLKNPIKKERLAAEQILGWVVSAERPLRWREIQSRFCIDPEAGTANLQRQCVKPCKYLCGSLVEVGIMGDFGDSESEGEVEMVHSSAKAYLIQAGTLCLSLEHAKMALFCTQYLTSHPLRFIIEKDIRAFALNGYYGFHDYATAFWWNHVDKLIEAHEELSFDTYSQTLQSVSKLFRAHLKSTDIHEEESKDFNAIARRFTELPRNPREREEVMSLEFTTETVRNAIEAIRDEGDSTYTVNDINTLPLYGPIRYKCPKPWCELFSIGLAKSEERKKHVNEHERPFHCTSDGCYSADIGFSTAFRLSQHVQIHHTQPEIALFPKPRQSGKSKKDICTAAEEGDLNSVRDLVATGSNIDLAKLTLKGNTIPLMLAVENGHLDVCEYLVSNGANVNFQAASNGESVLHVAVRQNNLEIIDLLLKQDKTVTYITAQELTAASLAAALGYYHSLSLFKELKPQTFDLQSCLIQAIKNDQIRTAQILLKGDSSSIHLSQSIISTLSAASNDMIRLLLSLDGAEKINQTAPRRTILHESCRLGDVRLTGRLIPLLHEVDNVDQAGQTPLEIAGGMGSIEIVSMLLASGRVDLRRDSDSILSKFAKYNTRIIEMFFEADPSLEIPSEHNGLTLLHYAVLEGNVELVGSLVQRGADVNAQSHSTQSCPVRSPFLGCDIDLVSTTPLKIALKIATELASLCYSLHHHWTMEPFKLIAQALVASDKVDLSYLDYSEELQFLVLLTILENKHLTWSLIERGLFSCRAQPYWREDQIAQLMIVLEKDIRLLAAVIGSKELLRDVMTTLVSETVSHRTKGQGGLLTLIRSNTNLANRVITWDSSATRAMGTEETRLVIEQAVRQNDEDLVQKLSLRSSDVASTALLLAAGSGTIEIIEAILKTGMADINTVDEAGQLPHEVALNHENFAVYDRLMLERGVFGKA